MSRDFWGTLQDFSLLWMERLQYLHSLLPKTMDWSGVLCQILLFFCSFSWLAASCKELCFSSSCHLTVYGKNQWELKPSTAIYKMQLLYTTHSKTPRVYMLRDNLCHLPPERYWSCSLNISQKACWRQAQGNIGLLALIYNLINNDLFLQLCSLLHCFLWPNLLAVTLTPGPLCLACSSSSQWPLDLHQRSHRRRLKWHGRGSYYF